MPANRKTPNKPRQDTTSPPAPGTAEIRGDWGSPDLPWRNAIFATLRPILPPGRGTVIVSPGLVRVRDIPLGHREGLVRETLARIARGLARSSRKTALAVGA